MSEQVQTQSKTKHWQCEVHQHSHKRCYVTILTASRGHKSHIPEGEKDCRLLKYEWITMDTGQDAELKAERYRKKN
jgi:hypothetical protein